MARTFVALPIPAKVRQRLSEEADRLRLTGAEVAWVRPQNYHLTIRFIGEIEDEELLILDPMLREIAASRAPMRLVVKGLATFEDRKTGGLRTIWCGAAPADDGDGLETLRKEVETGLSEAGYRRDKTRFVPHVTLGWFRGQAHVDALRERIGPAVRREFAHFTVPELILYESVPTAQGVAYEPLQRFPFGS